jgi:glyoxylase-like metal-dependent hydrolase (beta-lactamase superfamily II)
MKMSIASQLWLLLQLAFYTTPTLAATSVSTYDPVRSSEAIPPFIKPLGYRLHSFGDGAYMVTDGTYQGLFFIACESVIIVDAPPTIGNNIMQAIRSVTALPVSHVVYSHSHADHIGAAYLLGSPSNISFIAHQETADKLALSPDYEHRPYPTITFESSYTLQVCNQTLQLDYNGPNHEPGNIFIYAPLQKILMLVDIVYPGWIPFSNLGEVQNVPGYVKAHAQILTYDFQHYVGGHLDRTGTRQDVLIQQEYVLDLFNSCVDALLLSAQSKNNSNELSVEAILPAVEEANPGNPWALFATYIDVLAEHVANVTTHRWKDRLAGTDVYALSNAHAMLEPVRIDWGILGPFGVAN